MTHLNCRYCTGRSMEISFLHSLGTGKDFRFLLFASNLAGITLSLAIQRIIVLNIQLIFFFKILFFLFLVAQLSAQKMIIHEKIFVPFIFQLTYQHMQIVFFYEEIYFLTNQKIFYFNFTAIFEISFRQMYFASELCSFLFYFIYYIILKIFFI